MLKCLFIESPYFHPSPRFKSTCLVPFLFSSSPYRRNVASAPSVEEEGEGRGPGFSYGLNWALARRGVIVKDKAFKNLNASELRQKGATAAESLSGVLVHVRGNVVGEASKISKPQFSKLLKQVTTHISSISNIYVHDGAIGSSSICDAKVRVLSDSPSAILHLSSILWKTPARAVSHDSCPLTVYVASSISQGVVDSIGLGAQGNNALIAADIECASLILCGQAFSDTNGTKEALAALSGPVIASRGGLPLSGRILVSGDSVILLFASEAITQSCAGDLVSADAGVILSSKGVAPFFRTRNSVDSGPLKFPTAIVFATSDSSRIIPSISKLSPGQAAYHFLAGYQNGKFVPAYSKGPSSIDALELAKALLSELKDNQILSFLVNVKEGEKSLTGHQFLTLVQSALSKNVATFQLKGGDLRRKYKSFLSGKFQQIPKEFTF